jgi:alpha-ribazole phosphatase
MEMDFGSWEGLDWDAVPRAELDAWALDVWHYRPGGRESASMVALRWRRWSTALRRSGIEGAVAVTHAGLIRVALLSAGLLHVAGFAQAVIEHGSVHRIALKEPA